MDKWLVQEFDYTTKKFTGTYFDLADVDWFVDSTHGSDLNAGTDDAAFKTLGKAQTVATAGDVVMINGFFDESLNLSKALRWVGCGGGIGGRAVFGGAIRVGVASTYLDNIHIYSVSVFFSSNPAMALQYCSNCIFDNVIFDTSIKDPKNIYSYYCIFYKITTGRYFRLYGNNNILYQITVQSTGNDIYGNNNHSYLSSPSLQNYGFNNIINVDGEYLDPDNFNFNFAVTSPLYRAGTYNGTFDNYNHVGAGTVGLNFNGLDDELIETGVGTGTATYTNLTAVGSEIYRTNIAIDGILETGLIDFGEVKDKVVIDLYNTYEQENGELLRVITYSDGLTVREGLTFRLKYGNDADEVDECPWLVVEWGKEVTVSGTGASRVGNADATFDEDDYTTPSFQICIVEITYKTR